MVDVLHPQSPVGPPPRRRGGVPTVVVGLVLLAAIVGLLAALDRRESTGGGEVALSARPGAAEEAVAAAITSLDLYWRAELPRSFGRDFTPLAGGIQAQTSRSDDTTCGSARVTFEDVRGNAFYCPASDVIVYDAEELLPRLDNTFGSVAPAVVLAHEMGHAMQRRAGVEAPSVVVELQADCLAGAWTRFAQDDPDDGVAIEDGALDAAVRAVLTLRDQPGTAGAAPQAHGLGFDRVNAFQTGYEEGADRCAELPSGGVVTTELPFRTQAEAQTGGNLPYDEAVPLLVQSLDDFWAGALPSGFDVDFQAPRPVPSRGPLPDCPDGTYDEDAPTGYCPSENAVTWSDPALVNLHERIGDLATGALLSDVWAQAAQSQAELDVEGDAAALQRDCFTGAWIAALAGDQPETSPLSPGDLDEALAAIMAAGGPPGASDAGAFDRTDALRDGVLGGLESCR